MVQKPESAVSLYEVLRYLRNFFPGERWTCSNEPIRAASITLPGLMHGNGSFRPEDGVTRAELAAVTKRLHQALTE